MQQFFDQAEPKAGMTVEVLTDRPARSLALTRLATAFLRYAAMAVAWLGMPHARAETQYSEYEVKAECLSRFAQFVKWPAGGGSTTVGIVGEDPFGGALDKVAKVKRSRKIEDLKGCQIIFITKAERGNVGTILASIGKANVLTVGESDGFVKQGGVIGFTLVAGKVRFEINTGAAQRAGLGIDPRLLQLAVRVVNS